MRVVAELLRDGPRGSSAAARRSNHSVGSEKIAVSELEKNVLNASNTATVATPTTPSVAPTIRLW